jgi:uncharacterized membrane protein
MAQAPSTSAILPWRYGLFLLVFASAIPLSLTVGAIAGVMLGFDLGVLALLATLPSVLAHGADEMREHARRNDANRTLILALTGIVMMVILVIVASELRYGHGPTQVMLALIVATLILAWLFSNIIYTFHYAFLFYRSGTNRRDNGGLSFPRRAEPDYWDFAYFAFTLGMTFQTSDVEITDPAIRKVALFHSLAAFLFNLGIVAFTINILGGQ